MKKMLKLYLKPSTTVDLIKMGTHLLGGSQSWPSGAPANARRNGYETIPAEEW